MKILLDTHVFIWLDSAPENLSQTALNICQNQNNQLYLSIASVWEMQIKYQLGKLNLRLPIAQMLATQQQDNNLKILPIELNHIYQLRNLLLHHNDPFDRLLLAQSLQENMSIISADTKFNQYENVIILW
jgi:PIN domain nuclease of toxin-antitoxin system